MDADIIPAEAAALASLQRRSQNLCISMYMNDAVHPTRAGYLLWWLPQFQKILTEVLAKE